MRFERHCAYLVNYLWSKLNIGCLLFWDKCQIKEFAIFSTSRTQFSLHGQTLQISSYPGANPSRPDDGFNIQRIAYLLFLSQSCFVSVMSRNLKLFFHFKFFHFSIPITPVFSYNPFSFQFQSFQFLVPCLPVFQFQSFQFLVQILPVFSSNPFSFQFYPIQFSVPTLTVFSLPSSFSVPILPVFSYNSSNF